MKTKKKAKLSRNERRRRAREAHARWMNSTFTPMATAALMMDAQPTLRVQLQKTIEAFKAASRTMQQSKKGDMRRALSLVIEQAADAGTLILTLESLRFTLTPNILRPYSAGTTWRAVV